MRFAIANENGTVLDFQDSRMGDGNSEDVGGKVFEACLAGTYGLGIDIAVDLPDSRGGFDRRDWPLSFHRGTWL